jgi:hypothetical protein
VCGRSRHAVSYLQATRAKRQTCLTFCPCCPSFFNSIASCVDASVTAIAEERATANQLAVFALVLVLIIIFGVDIRLLVVKMAEDETVTASLK